MVVGASGAAKWLVLHGLESALFGQWFAGRKKPLHLYGTSIGAGKSAAAAQQNPKAAFDNLTQAYIHQHYQGRITPGQVVVEAERILNTFLGPGVPEEVLQHPYCRLNFSAVRYRGPLASDNPKIEMFGLAMAWLRPLRLWQSYQWQRFRIVVTLSVLLGVMMSVLQPGRRRWK